MLYKKIVERITLLLLTTSICLTGCVNPVLYHQTEGNVADATLRVEAARKMSRASGKPIPPLVVSQGTYVDRTPINLSKRPAWLKNHIVMRGEELPFSYYARTIANGGGSVLTRFQTGFDGAAKVSINYSGTVEGALDLLASKSGNVYSVNGRDIYWQSYITKTFDIAFMPGTSDYMMGKAQGGGGATSNASSGQNTVNAIVDDSAASQYSNMKGQLSVWKDLEVSIKQLLSPEGKVMVSESTTTVTVRDKPSNVDLISKFVSNLNKNLSKQVLIKVQIIDVSLSSDYVYGINWNVLQDAFSSGSYILTSNLGQPVSIVALGTTGGPAMLGLQRGTGAGVTALINALTQQGKVSVVTEPSGVTLNNQVAAIRIVNQNGYLASVQNTTVAGVAGGASNGTVTSQITPGTLVTGLTLYVLPKILGEKVYLQVNADISSNLGFQTISSTQGIITTTTANTSQIIQVPQVSQKQFNQRSIIGSGDTLILSGFKQVTNTANAAQLFDSQALGGRGAQQANVETIILITPVILHGCA